MKHKRTFVKGALCGALLTFLVVVVLGCIGLFWVSGRDGLVEPMTTLKMQTIRQLIESKYLYSDKIDEEALQEALLKGYVAGLGDPYSVYYDREETTDLMEKNSGKFVGIGVTIAQYTGESSYVFTEVLAGSPAEKAGVQDGDILQKVDGTAVAGLDMDTVVSMIKGERGTKVELELLRGEEQLVHMVTVTRDKVETNTVAYEMKDGQIGYIYVSIFEDVTYKQFETAIQDLTSQGMQALVIDLRGNPGGGFQRVCDMLDLILPEGVIISTKTKDGKEEVVRSDAERALDLPMAVVVNGQSGSASEVFAGAVQDYGIGKIVGTTTYGKGIVQDLFSLGDGTCLKLTTSEYFTPKGRSIHGVGIKPDVEVEYVYDENAPQKDNQLEAALTLLQE